MSFFIAAETAAMKNHSAADAAGEIAHAEVIIELGTDYSWRTHRR